MKCGLILAAAWTLSTSAAIAAAPLGDTECIQLSQIQDSPAIDDRTILVKLNGTDNYKRIDILGTCPGLAMSGFTHKTPEGRLCRSDPLTVRQPSGVTCKIDKIVTIDAAEAKELESRR